MLLQLPAPERDDGGGGGDGLAERAGDDGHDGIGIGVVVFLFSAK